MREFVLGRASFDMSEGKLLSCEVIHLLSLPKGKLNKVISNLTEDWFMLFSHRVLFQRPCG